MRCRPAMQISIPCAPLGLPLCLLSIAIALRMDIWSVWWAKGPFCPYPLHLTLYPKTFAILWASLRHSKQIQFSFYFWSTHLKVLILNWPESGSLTCRVASSYTVEVAQSGLSVLSLPTQILEYTPMGDCVRLTRADQLDKPEIPVMTQHAWRPVCTVSHC